MYPAALALGEKMSEVDETVPVEKTPKKTKPKGLGFSMLSASLPTSSKDAGLISEALAEVAKAATKQEVAFTAFTGLLGTGKESSRGVKHSPIKNTVEPSGLAQHVLEEFGAGYEILVPSGPNCENYAFYDPKQIALVRQYPDVVLSKDVQASRAIFEHVKSGLRFAVGVVSLPAPKDDDTDSQGTRDVPFEKLSKALDTMGENHNLKGLPLILAGSTGVPAPIDPVKNKDIERVGTLSDNSNVAQIYASKSIRSDENDSLEEYDGRKTVQVSDVHSLVIDVKKL